MKTVCMWLGFAVAFITFQFVGNDLFPTSSDRYFEYNWERAVAVALVGGAGGLIGRSIGGLLEGAGEDNG